MAHIQAHEVMQCFVHQQLGPKPFTPLSAASPKFPCQLQFLFADQSHVEHVVNGRPGEGALKLDALAGMSHGHLVSTNKFGRKHMGSYFPK